MRYLLLISTLTTSLMFSAASWAEWTAVAEGVDGTKVYVDLERIRKANGMVYYWTIQDFLEPSSGGDLSNKVYYKADCKTMRTMRLSFSAYKTPMAEGTADDTWTPPEKWLSAQPDSVLEIILQAVCAH